MLKKLSPAAYVSVAMLIIVILEVVVKKVQAKMFIERKKGELLENDVLFIKDKLKDMHSERVNFYLNEYYNLVDYNPIKTMGIYLILNMASIKILFSLLSPPENILNANPSFLFFNNVFDKLDLSLRNIDPKSFSLIFAVGLISFISGTVRSYHNDKKFNKEGSKDRNIFSYTSFKSMLISLGITFVMYYLLNLRKILIIIIIAKSLISIIYHLISMAKGFEDNPIDDFNKYKEVNVMSIVNRALKDK